MYGIEFILMCIKTLKADVPETVTAEWKEIYDAVLKQKGKDQVCLRFHIQHYFKYEFNTHAGICYPEEDVHGISGKFDVSLFLTRAYLTHIICS